ncbi:hypothetical protein B0H10DRAFT_1960358 [Mycena sp. CBHHK59/15]|nr:hypothetical protein B0H10DRAFT_1960358 [Mycena sp. CBHHK59/15]
MPQMSSRPSFDIGHAAPLLNSLSLSDEALESTAYFPEMGYSYFFQFTLRPFVHTLVRAVTHDFTELDHLPAYSATEGRQIRTWLLILLYHFRMVSRTLGTRRAGIEAHDLYWLSTEITVPGEAFQMLQITVFMCHYVGLPPEVPSGDHPRPCVLVPLFEASSETLLCTRCRGEYADYDENGHLVCSTLLRWDDGFGIELDLATSVAPHDFTMILLAMGVTGPYAPISLN